MWTRIAMAAAAALVLGNAVAQQYPSKPVRMVVPWPPGGTSDILARPLAQKLTESLGQSMVVDNRGGSSGVIGMEIVAKSAPDGYTIALHSVTGHLINATFYPSLGYNTERDFVPVTLVGQVPHIIVAHPSLPARSVKELIALAKSRPGDVNYASFGNGSTSHVAGELFKQMTKVSIAHVPYKGGGPALIDTLGGHVTLYFATFAPPLPHVKSGKLKGLGVTGAKRSAVLPDVPTVAETPGLQGYEMTAMFGVLAPAGTPAPIVQRLQAEILKAINTTDYRQRLLNEGVEEAIGSTPEQTAAYLKSELQRLTKILNDANIRSDAR